MSLSLEYCTHRALARSGGRPGLLGWPLALRDNQTGTIQYIIPVRHSDKNSDTHSIYAPCHFSLRRAARAARFALGRRHQQYQRQPHHSISALQNLQSEQSNAALVCESPIKPRIYSTPRVISGSGRRPGLLGWPAALLFPALDVLRLLLLLAPAAPLAHLEPSVH